ncbi:MAG: ABC transporter substrate-binding protein [Dehalococcoidales bacterium]|nr:ABC transporter substrate-binding protein [Dehalococcoidales bacterium]
MFKRLILALFLVMAMVVTGCASQPKEKKTLKIGSLPRIFDMIAYTAQQEGLFAKQGIDVEIVPFRSTVEMTTALTTGELDGIIQDIFDAVNLNKEGETAKLVGCSVMPRQFEIVTCPGSDIACPSDLKGKEIATATSTIMDYALDRLLVANGLTPADIVKVNVPIMPLRVETVSQGKVPAAILTPPLSDLVVLNGGKVIANDEGEPFAGPGLVFSLEALKNKPDAISKCIQSWQQAVELINANPDKYQELLNEVAFVPESVNLDVPTFPKLGLPSEAQVETVVNWFMDNGLMDKPVAYEDVVDTSYLAR